MKSGLKRIRYEVRTKGEGSYEYFTEVAWLPHYLEPKYDEHSVRSAKKYAKSLESNGLETWVVKITEEVL